MADGARWARVGVICRTRTRRRDAKCGDGAVPECSRPDRGPRQGQTGMARRLRCFASGRHRGRSHEGRHGLQRVRGCGARVVRRVPLRSQRHRKARARECLGSRHHPKAVADGGAPQPTRRAGTRGARSVPNGHGRHLEPPEQSCRRDCRGSGRIFFVPFLGSSARWARSRGRWQPPRARASGAIRERRAEPSHSSWRRSSRPRSRRSVSRAPAARIQGLARRVPGAPRRGRHSPVAHLPA